MISVNNCGSPKQFISFEQCFIFLKKKNASKNKSSVNSIDPRNGAEVFSVSTAWGFFPPPSSLPPEKNVLFVDLAVVEKWKKNENEKNE